MAEILIVEDEEPISNLIKMSLKKAGYQCRQAFDGYEAADCMEKDRFDLILLDIMLPGIDGYELLEYSKLNKTPVIFITAMGDLNDRVKGLRAGADDYITKPFNPLEVVARVKTQLRRYQRYNNPAQIQPAEKSEYDIRGLIINKDSHKCFLFGKELQLTPIEFSILWYLCEHQGKVVPSEELFEAVWKEKYLNNNNTVMAHIGRLREKMNEPAKKPKFIKTVWGVGYEIE